MGGDLVTTLGIITAKTIEELVVGVNLGGVLGLLAVVEVSPLDNVVILVLINTIDY